MTKDPAKAREKEKGELRDVVRTLSHVASAGRRPPPRHGAGHASARRRRLQPDFEYRDLGLRDVTGGRYVAHVIRAIPGKESRPVRHHHEVEVQIVNVIRGWITFRYDGVGEVKLVAGSCVHQPAGLPHVEVGHSEDLEMVEIAAPADFRTVND